MEHQPRPISRRAVLRPVAATGVTLLGAACGGQGPSGTGPSPAADSRPGGKIVWSFWAVSQEQSDAAMARIKDFTVQNPTIQVEPFYTDWAAYREKITAMISAATPPELMQVDAYWMPTFVEQQLIQRLEPFMRGDKSFKLDAFLPGAFMDRHHVFGGAYYAVPNGPESPRVLFYNKQRFLESGLPLPNTLDEQGKWTWDSYVETTTRLSKGTSPQRYFGTRDNLVSTGHYTWILSNGGNTLADDYKTCTIDKKETLDALQFQADLIHKHRVAPGPSEDLGPGNAFHTGRVAMFLGGAWDAAPLRNVAGLEYGVVAVPKSPRGTRKTMLKPNALTIPTGVKGQPAATAWELIKFVASPTYQKGQIDDGIAITNLKELVDYFLKQSPIQNAKVFMDAYEHKEVAPIPLIAKWVEFETIVNEDLNKVRSGENGLPAAAGNIKARVNELLRA
ncbi:MAG TPA: sugar ABC transporter substrate-binding protein [Chloroflexota bacterium]|nr:sugar ABC transporter substrate-binding protein [Chloroflexota bacterium]